MDTSGTPGYMAPEVNKNSIKILMIIIIII
jgi:hypothetical protein